MRRLHFVLVMVLLLAASCAEGTGPATTAVAVTSTTGGSTTTTTGPTSTAAPEWPSMEVSVTNDDGVFYIDSTGAIIQLVKGRVAYAVDDTRGGLLFQVERGRSSGWWGDASPIKDTRVWWVPQGSSEAQELMVATPGLPFDLSLYDAFSDRDGNVRVLYVRHDSTWDPEVGPFTFVDSLRTLAVETGQVVELASWPGYEAGLGLASGSGNLVAVTFFGQIDSACGFLNPVSGEEVLVPGAPRVEPDCEADCPSGCVVSDGWVAYKRTTSDGPEVVVSTGGGGSVSFEFEGLVGPLDATGMLLLVNHRSEWRLIDDGPATVIDLDSGHSWRLPIKGLARFVSPVDIPASVIPPTPAAIQLRADGLGLVDFGDPVDAVVDLMTGVLGVVESDTLDTGGAAAGVTCSERTGMACDAYLRTVVWNSGLSLVFSDLHPYGGDGPAFVGWSAWKGVEQLATVDGIGPGSTVNAVTTVYGDALEWIWERDCGVDFYLLPGGEGAIYGSVNDDVSMPVPHGYEPDQGSRVEWLGGGMLGDC